MSKAIAVSEANNSRRAALAQLEKLAERIGARNQDLTAEAADALADQFVREIINEMIAEGKIQYEP